MDSIKKKSQEYWSRLPPGANYPSKDVPYGSKEFYQSADRKRYQLDPYFPTLAESLKCDGKDVLEVGCGLGSDSRLFASLGGRVVSVDLSVSNARHAKHGFETCGLNGTVIVSDAEHLPFKDASFDIVYSLGVLHHTPDTQHAVNEVHRTLRHDGRALVMIYNKGLAYYWILLVYGVLRFELLRTKITQMLSKRYDGAPLSQMFSRKQARGLFSKFSEQKITCVNFGVIQEHPILRILWKIYRTFPLLERLLGSFLIIEARKS